MRVQAYTEPIGNWALLINPDTLIKAIPADLEQTDHRRHKT